jgi:hypothetical protein
LISSPSTTEGSTMTDTGTLVIGGVDAHHDTHHAVALDERGRRLGDAEFPTTSPGYEQLLGWLADFGTILAVGAESTGSYAAGLTRLLLAAGVAVVEINQPHAHLRHRRGKNQPEWPRCVHVAHGAVPARHNLGCTARDASTGPRLRPPVPRSAVWLWNSCGTDFGPGRQQTP